MTKDDVIRMAREAGIDEWWASGNEDREDLQELLERFAQLVAAVAFKDGYEKGTAGFMEAVRFEREACAKVCEDIASSGENNDRWTITRDIAFNDCAAAIRARGHQ